MKVAHMMFILFLGFMIIGGCNEADDNGGNGNQPTVTQAPPTPSPPPNPCPCEDGCCDSSGQCKSGEHCMTMPLTNQTTVAQGMQCTFEIKGIDCMDCCNLNAARLKGQEPSPIRENSTLERSDSRKDVSPDEIGTVSSSGSGWESAWDTTFGCSGNPIGCGNGSYTAVLTFEKGCPETIELCFRLP